MTQYVRQCFTTSPSYCGKRRGIGKVRILGIVALLHICHIAIGDQICPSTLLRTTVTFTYRDPASLCSDQDTTAVGRTCVSMRLSALRPSATRKRRFAKLGSEFLDRATQERSLPRCVRAAYYRRLNKRYPTLMGIGEPSDAWQQLSLTWEARRSSGMEDTMILYQKTQLPTVVLASALDLEILHQSRHWVCDESSDKCPELGCWHWPAQGPL
ncbi:uncharacterized protein LOC135397780 isoform X2 [Ornithodoros turicata]|uniref:uncharacterized protein LOC135397780 isoform X2 n=1 Tax=Ornithodoros turicata TaxID=34597 RepID=UPI00313915E4